MGFQKPTYMTISEIQINKIEGFIRSIRLCNKKPADIASEVNLAFAKLKPLNEGMHIELMNNYKKVVEDSKNRK